MNRHRRDASLRVALVSMKHREGDVAFNLDRHRQWLGRGVEAGARFIGFPEFALTGWIHDPDLAIGLQSPAVAQLQAWAREYRVFLGTCMVERKGRRLHNTAVLIGPQGVAGTMRKVNLVTAETRHYTPGRTLGVFDVGGVKMGIATCADATRFETFRILSWRGAEVVYAPHANVLGGYGNSAGGWSRWRMERWPLFARDNAVAIAGVNNAGRFESGRDAPSRYCGGAMVMDHQGHVLAQPPARGKRESMIVADIDLEALRTVRANLDPEFRGDILYGRRLPRHCHAYVGIKA